MKIIDNISKKRQKIKAKRVEKKLIKSDDETVVEVLSQNEDNSDLNIQKIVQNMDDPENMVEVIENNLEEIIEQNNVKDTLQFLPDENITRIVEENSEELKDQEKMVFAILPIKNNLKKLKYVNKNLGSLTDFEVLRILQSLKPENNSEVRKEIEHQKLQIVGNKVFQNIKKSGSAFHLREFLGELSDQDKMNLFNMCMKILNDNKDNSNIAPNANLRFAEDFSYAYDLDWEKCIENKLLTPDEVCFIKRERERKQIKKDAKEKSHKVR